jgi:hypothetical protein
VAGDLKVPAGALVMIVKSATIYATDAGAMRDAIAAAGPLVSRRQTPL